MSFFQSLVTYLGDVVSPWQCAACDENLQKRNLFCEICAHTVVTCPEVGAFVDPIQPIAFGYYGGALASCLRRLKYGNRPDLGGGLGQLLAPVIVKRLGTRRPQVVLVVPVPNERLAQRGYNQVSLIAKPIAKALQIKLKPRVLGRRDGSVKQAALNRAQRLENLVDAFFVRDHEAIEGRDVLLIDDVCTTGATLASCSKLLADCGAKSVTTAVVATVM